ncbi:MAG: PatB family C-S lyase [Pseudomonadota bacterium]
MTSDTGHDPRFDEIVDRRGTNSSKWDGMEALFGVSPDDGLSMWVADKDFRAPETIRKALADYAASGVYGYAHSDQALREATAWWMQQRHGWTIDPKHVLSANGMVNAIALAIDAFSEPGDGVVIFTPVYHAFRRVILASERDVIDCPMRIEDGRHVMDFEAYNHLIPAHTRLLILCSPHNPGGQVWRPDELRALAAFAARHNLIILSDEIHHDLVYSGQTHTPLPLAAPDVLDRLIMLTATTKTFNIAGAHIAQAIIPDEALRRRFDQRRIGLATKPGALSLLVAEAAYSPECAEWVDGLMDYLDGNRQLFDDGLNAIPGVRSMPLEATYLSWVDFTDTGMDRAELTRRVREQARIAASPGESFGTQSETWLRFNIGMPRAHIVEAIARLQSAFSDLQ